MRIAIFGNCQTRPLAASLLAASPEVDVVGTVIVHLAQDAEADRVLSQLEAADVVLAQRVADNYPTEFVRNVELRRHFGDKVVVWPNLYYRGYNPELVYLRDDAHRPLQGPMGDYHVSTVHEAWQEGADQAEAVRRCKSVEHNRAAFSAIPEQSLTELRERESDADVAVSDHVDAHRWDTRLFWTFNHPTTALLDVLAARVLDRLGLPTGGGPTEGEPLGRWRLPLNVWVKDQFGPAFEDRARFQGAGVDLTGPVPVAPAKPWVRMNYRELVAAYYSVYDRVFTRPE